MPDKPEYNYEDKNRIKLSTSKNTDIFFIVFDSFTGFNSLEKYWNYNDKETKTFLNSHNFLTLDSARSNYNYTTLSISSILNMNYFDQKLVDNNTEAIVAASLMHIKNNYMTTLFESAGYKIINITPFDLGGQEKYYNTGFFENEPNNIFTHFIDQTALGVFYNRAKMKPMYELNLQAMDRLQGAIKDSSAPKFVYAHFMMPHDPFFFDKDGNIIPDSERKGSNSKRNKNNYLGQLLYSNKKIEEIVNLIFSQKDKDPIIIFQGDHGYRFLERPTGGREESHSTLFAIHLPQDKKVNNVNDITGVNLFRYILNTYYGFNYPMLDHKEFFVPIVED